MSSTCRTSASASGMQTAVIEFARDAAGLAGANSGEFDPESPHKVIDFMPGQSESVDKGGTLRLGACPCEIVPARPCARCYGQDEVWERHRHRYELNNALPRAPDRRGPDAQRPRLRTAGLSKPLERRLGALPSSAWQYHPEFKSRRTAASPPLYGFRRPRGTGR
ncbi:MAG: glutamine amidotransferase-related protein [Lachnospiraceae bacterium]